MVNEHLGEAILRQAVDLARETWGDRLSAAYALGSLAHGGFSDLVSDVDLGLILADPLQARDQERVAEIAVRVSWSGAPLSDRLSIFWGSLASLRGEVVDGRFPPLDRLDLIQYGRLLGGREARRGLPAPDTRELVIAAVDFALRSLGQPEVIAELADPAGLVAAGPRRLTKRILFPVRFLYTARTGEIGRNEAAVAHLLASESGPITDLVAAAFRWRDDPPDPHDPTAITLVEAGLIPLYHAFLDDHEQRLAAYGETDRAERLASWRRTLDEGSRD